MSPAAPNEAALPPPPELIILEWEEICTAETSPKLLAQLETALGPSGIGLVAIRGVPDFWKTKQSFLPKAHSLVHLPADYLEEELTDVASLYNSGWSHGKEKLGANKAPDFAKGSFYYNPVTDLPGTAEERAKYPYSYPLNKWPSADRMPGFQTEAQAMGLILKTATVALAKHIDALAATKCATYPPQFLYQDMKETDKVKARLLYYFPLATAAKEGGEATPTTPPSEDSWIGWHNDSGFLTALGGDMYVHHETGAVVDCPDPAAGLYVTDRLQQAHKVHLPPDCCAIQMGECTQIVTGGAVRATPHCVRGASNAPHVARISLPCFVDTPPYQPLAVPPLTTRDQVLDVKTQSPKVPPLGPRWTVDGMTLGEFLQTTFAMYYDWSATPKTVKA